MTTWKASFPNGKVIEGTNAQVLEFVVDILKWRFDESPLHNIRFEREPRIEAAYEEAQKKYKELNQDEMYYVDLIMGYEPHQGRQSSAETERVKEYFELVGIYHDLREEVDEMNRKNPFNILFTSVRHINYWYPFEPTKALLHEIYEEILSDRLTEDSPYWKWAQEEIERVKRTGAPDL